MSPHNKAKQRKAAHPVTNAPLPDTAPTAQDNKATRGRGRPAGRSKVVVSVSLDADLVAALKASGAGWQTRLNDLIKSATRLCAHID